MAGNLYLRAREATQKGEEAKGGESYLFLRLRCPPDVDGFSSRRWRSSGRCRRRRLLARAGAASECSSGASQTVGQKLRSSAEDLKLLGSQVAARGRGDCSLLLGLDGAFRRIAGGPAKGSGCLEGLSGECGESLRAGLILGLEVTQVFVVKFGVCGGWLGLMFGALGRWRPGEYLGGVWEDAVDCGEGNFRGDWSWLAVSFCGGFR